MPTRAERRAARAVKKAKAAAGRPGHVAGSAPAGASSEAEGSGGVSPTVLSTPARPSPYHPADPVGGHAGAVAPAAVPLRDKVISSVVSAITKKFGKDAVQRLGDEGAYPEIKRRIPTGIPSLDYALGTGGLPLGRFIEISGVEASGKTTLCKYLAGRCQQLGVYPVILDTEHSGILEYDKALGLDTGFAIGGQPDSLEDVFGIMEAAILQFRTLDVDCLLIFDSLAATLTKSELELGWDDEGQRGRRAAYLAKNLPKLVKLLEGTTNVGMVWTNQVRDNMDAARNPYAPKTKTTGGRALRHWAHIRVEMRPHGTIKQGDVVVALRTRAKVIKNKCAPPNREADLEIYHDPPQVVAAAETVGRSRRQPMRDLPPSPIAE